MDLFCNKEKENDDNEENAKLKERIENLKQQQVEQLVDHVRVEEVPEDHK
jgi:hypothetical protein